MSKCKRRYKPEVQRVIDHAEAEGWTWSRTLKGHIKFLQAGCQPVFFGTTPSDRRAVLNSISNLNKSKAARA